MEGKEEKKGIRMNGMEWILMGDVVVGEEYVMLGVG